MSRHQVERGEQRRKEDVGIGGRMEEDADGRWRLYRSDRRVAQSGAAAWDGEPGNWIAPHHICEPCGVSLDWRETSLGIEAQCPSCLRPYAWDFRRSAPPRAPERAGVETEETSAEPVAWRLEFRSKEMGGPWQLSRYTADPSEAENYTELHSLLAQRRAVPLYAHPPAGPSVVDVVAAVRRNEDGLYWLCRRSSDGKHAGLAGMWEYPGGKVEPNEQLRDALVREMFEEFGIDSDPKIGAVLDSIEARYGDTTYRVTFFEVELNGPIALLTHTEARWMTAREACSVDHLPSGTIFNARHLAGPSGEAPPPSGLTSERHLPAIEAVIRITDHTRDGDEHGDALREIRDVLRGRRG